MTIEQILVLVEAHKWLALIAALILVVNQGLKEKAAWFPWNVSNSIRALLVLVLGAIGASFNAVTEWSGLKDAFLAQLLLIGPSLIPMLIDLIFAARSGKLQSTFKIQREWTDTSKTSQ
jgi:hypothetical protein